MTINEPIDAFVALLSHARSTTERSAKIYTELGKLAENPDVETALNARAFVQTGTLAKIDEAFRLIGKKPVEFPGTLTEKMVENFREEVAEIKAPAIKRLFVLSKAIQIAHWRIGEWVALVAASDVTGNFGVGVLLETCLAEDLAFAERTRRILRKVAEERVAARQAGK
jgi:ferritin-like metal-binding protein YciE